MGRVVPGLFPTAVGRIAGGHGRRHARSDYNRLYEGYGGLVTGSIGYILASKRVEWRVCQIEFMYYIFLYTTIWLSVAYLPLLPPHNRIIYHIAYYLPEPGLHSGDGT